MAHEVRWLGLLVGHSPVERVEFLEERDERMHAANARRPVIVEGAELPLGGEFVLDEHAEEHRELLEVPLSLSRCLRALALPSRDPGQGRDRAWLDLEVKVFREPLDEGEALGERSTALEPNLETGSVQRPKQMGDPVVLLDESEREAALGGSDPNEVRKVAVVVDEGHVLAARIDAPTSA